MVGYSLSHLFQLSNRRRDYYERRRIPYVAYTQGQNYRSILDISFYRTADNRVPLHLYVTASLPEGKIILTLFDGYIDLIRHGNWFSFTYLFFGNIIWFVPFGMYLQYRGKTRTLWHAAICGFLFSLLIETMQYVFGTGFSELDDLALNTLGAWIGAAVVKFPAPRTFSAP